MVGLWACSGAHYLCQHQFCANPKQKTKYLDMQAVRFSRQLSKYSTQGYPRCPNRLVHASSPLCIHESGSTSSPQPPAPFYSGPLAQTFHNLKLFSLSSLGIIAGLSPALFVVDAPGIPLSARGAMAATALAMSGASTGLIAWCGAPYVSSMRRLTPPPTPFADARKDETSDDPSALISTAAHLDTIEMTTKTLFLKKLHTQVYDPAILGPTNRLFATWELQSQIRAPASASRNTTRTEEVIARTLDAEGKIRGEWRVRWTQDPSNKQYLRGHASAAGTILRYAIRTKSPYFVRVLTNGGVHDCRHFNVHEELLAGQAPAS